MNEHNRCCRGRSWIVIITLLALAACSRDGDSNAGRSVSEGASVFRNLGKR